MSTNRKKRTKEEAKKRKAKFQNKRAMQTNQIKRYYKQQQQIRNLQEEMIRKASIVEKLYKAKGDEFAIVKDEKLQLNEEFIIENDDKILVWSKDKNPILSGIETLENLEKYSKEFVNDVLNHIHLSNIQKNVDIEMEDFELIEGDTEDIEVIEVGTDKE